MNDRTLAVNLGKFNRKEKAVMCFALNVSKVARHEVHQGTLPFIRADDVIAGIDWINGTGRPVQRILASIKAKLRALYGIDESTSFDMGLDSAKVARVFGPHPERGHPIRNVQKKRVTVGVRWSLPKRDFEPDDNVLVAPHVVLHKKSFSPWWRVTCEQKYAHTVRAYLMEHCQ